MITISHIATRIHVNSWSVVWIAPIFWSIQVRDTWCMSVMLATLRKWSRIVRLLAFNTALLNNQILDFLLKILSISQRQHLWCCQIIEFLPYTQIFLQKYLIITYTSVISKNQIVSKHSSVVMFIFEAPKPLLVLKFPPQNVAGKVFSAARKRYMYVACLNTNVCYEQAQLFT